LAAVNHNESVINVMEQITASDIDWGDIPTAVGAVVASAALIAAIVAAMAARSVLRVELSRDKARDEADERLQAEKIAAWPSLAPANPTIVKSKLTWGIAVRNASELPVYQVWLVKNPIGGVGGEDNLIYELVAPGDWVVIDTTLWARSDVPKTLPGQRIPDRDFLMSIKFTDAAGRRWARDSKGILSRVEE
jgi:hypothetical protein